MSFPSLSAVLLLLPPPWNWLRYSSLLRTLLASTRLMQLKSSLFMTLNGWRLQKVGVKASINLQNSTILWIHIPTDYFRTYRNIEIYLCRDSKTRGLTMMSTSPFIFTTNVVRVPVSFLSESNSS